METHQICRYLKLFLNLFLIDNKGIKNHVLTHDSKNVDMATFLSIKKN